MNMDDKAYIFDLIGIMQKLKKKQWICNESSIYVRLCKGCQNKEQGGIFWTGSIGGSHGSHKKMETTG